MTDRRPGSLLARSYTDGMTSNFWCKNILTVHGVAIKVMSVSYARQAKDSMVCIGLTKCMNWI
jgi:hypothetical protein